MLHKRCTMCSMSSVVPKLSTCCPSRAFAKRRRLSSGMAARFCCVLPAGKRLLLLAPVQPGPESSPSLWAVSHEWSQLSRSRAGLLLGTATCLTRSFPCLQVIGLEKALHFFWEQRIQHFFLRWPDFVRFWNVYYWVAHGSNTIGALLALFFIRPAIYQVRFSVVCFHHDTGKEQHAAVIDRGCMPVLLTLSSLKTPAPALLVVSAEAHCCQAPPLHQRACMLPSCPG